VIALEAPGRIVKNTLGLVLKTTWLTFVVLRMVNEGVTTWKLIHARNVSMVVAYSNQGRRHHETAFLLFKLALFLAVVHEALTTTAHGIL